jgi:two-component sensor histidine kinase
MMKLGPTAGEIRAMSVDDIFLSRLKLLIIMAKAYLKKYPLGKYRKSAVIENAHHVFYHSLQLVSETFFFEKHESESQSGITSEIEIEEEREFHQRVKLLAVMVKALAEDRLTGHISKKSLQNNLNRICDTLTFTFHIKDVDFLKVA